MEASSVGVNGKAARSISLGGGLLWQGGDYAELEWLESTGTQWIDTGVKANEDTAFDADFQLTVLVENGLLLGENKKRIAIYSSTENLIRMYRNGWGINADLAKGDNLYNRHYFVSLSPTKILLDGTTLLSLGVTGSITGFLHLFKTPDVYNGGCFKLYSFKIRQDDIPVRSFLPARRISDGALGMYDKVTKQFFTNQGSGEFVAGPETGRRL